MRAGATSGGPCPPWVLDVFSEAATNVVAYRRFLTNHGVDPDGRISSGAWPVLPLMTKDYLRSAPLSDLLNGGLGSIEIVSSSSGSSGEPFFWPRGESAEGESTMYHRRILDSFGCDQHRTLVVISYSMGSWIAGSYTLEGIRRIARSNPNVAVVCPGISIDDNLQVLRGLAPQFEQVVMFGYPPLVMDILLRARDTGIDVAGLHIRLSVAGENISEQWRDRALKLIAADDPLTSVISVYGTADAGLIGHETPATIAVRRIAADKPNIAAALFPLASVLPTLVAIDTETRYVEQVDGSIVFTTRGVLPLIRYRIGDLGQVLHRSEVEAILRQFEVAQDDSIVLPETMVAIYGRTDVATTFYAVNIYPENIKYGIEPFIETAVTGKFVASTLDLANGESQLCIRVQLQDGVAPSAGLSEAVRDSVVDGLMDQNSEYRRLRSELGNRADPIVDLVPCDSAEFEFTVKHRWVAK